MKLTLRDLFWAIALIAVILSWIIDSNSEYSRGRDTITTQVLGK